MRPRCPEKFASRSFSPLPPSPLDSPLRPVLGSGLPLIFLKFPPVASPSHSPLLSSWESLPLTTPLFLSARASPAAPLLLSIPRGDRDLHYLGLSLEFPYPHSLPRRLIETSFPPLLISPFLFPPENSPSPLPQSISSFLPRRPFESKVSFPPPYPSFLPS
ncbi:hypothetical protein Zmor_001706 [Zophobas morio]|uniref:Uncharacterized protein n=1 Tax=Zophobas morio TaxID=2755281 RepID=A0AA38IZI4_9CUCU|nr:hypothetical protein Zmor_001706 [Zophobas morio]